MFKSMKIGKKLIVSFILVSIIASISGVVSVLVMGNIDARYSAAMVDYGFAQGDVGKLLSAFCRVDGNVHDAVGYLNAADKEAAKNNIEKQSAKLAPYFDAIEKSLRTDTTREAFKIAKTSWDAYLTKARELAIASASSDSVTVAKVQQRIVEELDPIYMLVYDNLSVIMDSKVNTGSTLNDELSANSAISILTSWILIVVAMAISILLGIFVSRGISRPVKECAERIEKLAKGDLTSPVPTVKSKDETGVLAGATTTIVMGLAKVIQDMVYLLEQMSEGNFDVKTQADEAYIGDFQPLLLAMRSINTRLSDTISQINQSADQVASGSDQVSSGAQALSQGATEQASSVQELAATITEISHQIKSNAENAKNASSIVNSTGSEIQQSNQKMQDLIAAMGQISSSSQEIGKVIKTIEDIAFQTNILALNAAVEAARAGAAGKGFAVVADEVRNLASKSAEAAKGTTVLIESSVKSVENGTQIAGDTAKSLLAVVEGARRAVETVDRISVASGEQATSIAQVTQGVEQISSVVQTNSATAEESAAASEELSGQAQVMKGLVSRFTLRKETGDTQVMQHKAEPEAHPQHSYSVDKY